MKVASDFIGQHIGESENRARSILAASAGCVLVIDEAYGLCPKKHSGADSFKESVINVLVEGIQNRPGEDRAVLMLGYRPDMEQVDA